MSALVASAKLGLIPDQSVVQGAYKCRESGGISSKGLLVVTTDGVFFGARVFHFFRKESALFSDVREVTLRGTDKIRLVLPDRELVFTLYKSVIDQYEAHQLIMNLWQQHRDRAQQTASGNSFPNVLPPPVVSNADAATAATAVVVATPNAPATATATAAVSSSSSAAVQRRGQLFMSATRVREVEVLNDDDWDLLLKSAKRVVFSRDQVIVHYGERLQHLYQVTSGVCRIEQELPGDQVAIIGRMYESETFGEISFLQTSVGATAAVIADSDKVEVSVIEGHVVATLFGMDAHFPGRFMKYLCVSLAERVQKREEDLINAAAPATDMIANAVFKEAHEKEK